MIRKGMDRGKANLALRLLMYFRTGLYSVLWSMSQSAIMNHYEKGDDSQVHSNQHDANDRQTL